MYAIGIDLGTSNSLVSVYKKGKVEIIKVEGVNLVPSVVSFRSPDNMLVGKQAKKMAEMYPENTVIEVKRKMGDMKHRYKIFSNEYTPVEISSFIIKKLVEGAKKALGEEVADVVITVPAYFTDQQREDTKKAGEKAGLNVLQLLSEPTAAAIAYGFDREKDQTLLVYDLGGGTFDVSILNIRGNKFEVAAVNGNHDLGGRDFDEAIVDYALNVFKKETGADLKKLQKDESSEEVSRAFQLIKEAAEKAKFSLTETEITSIDLPNLYKGNHLSVELARTRFEKMIKPFILQTKDLVKKTIKEAKLTVDDIDRVVLVGGSTKIPLIKKIVTETIKEPFIAGNVDEIVCAGAGLVAANRAAPDENVVGLPEDAESTRKIKDINFKDITAHSLGTEVFEYNTGGTYFSPLIEKNSKIPCKGFFLGQTARPYQTAINIIVFRGENRDCKKNKRLGSCLLSEIPSRPEEVPVGIWFELDRDGILHVKGAVVEFNNPYRVYEYIRLGKTNELKEGADYKIIRSVNTKIVVSA